MQRDIHATKLPHLTGPHPRTIHGDLTGNGARIGSHRCHTSTIGLDRRYSSVFEHSRAPVTRASRKRLGRIRWISLAIFWQENASHQIISLDQRM